MNQVICKNNVSVCLAESGKTIIWVDIFLFMALGDKLRYSHIFFHYRSGYAFAIGTRNIPGRVEPPSLVVYVTKNRTSGPRSTQ